MAKSDIREEVPRDDDKSLGSQASSYSDPQASTDEESRSSIEPPSKEKLSALEQLPVEIQREIFRYLLQADCVRQPLDENFIQPYHFHTAILYTSKRLSGEAKKVLDTQNRFAIIRCNLELFISFLEGHEVAIVCKQPNLVARFEAHVLSLKIEFLFEDPEDEWSLSEGTAETSFLLLSDDLPSFVRCLQILDLMDNFPYDSRETFFTLELQIESLSGSVPTLRAQQAVLEPFRCFKTQPGDVNIGGKVDQIYARELQLAMMPDVQWDRANAWQFYRLVVSMKDMADKALRVGNARLAKLRYAECTTMLTDGFHGEARICDLGDDVFHSSCAELFENCIVNHLLASLKDLEHYNDSSNLLKETGDLFRLALTPIFEYEQKTIYHYRAHAWAYLDNDSLAHEQLIEAEALDPSDEVIQQDIQIIERRLEAQAYNEDPAAADQLTSQHLPDEPLPISPPIYAPVSTIANERCLLRHLRYRGPMLEEIGELENADVVGMERMARWLEGRTAKVLRERYCGIWVVDESLLNQRRSRTIKKTSRTIKKTSRTIPGDEKRIAHLKSRKERFSWLIGG